MSTTPSSFVRAKVVRADPASHAAFAEAILQHLSLTFEGLPKVAPEGVHAFEFHHGSVRIAARSSERFLAIEVLCERLADSWEAFHLSLADGTARCGWRRRGASAEPPEPWLLAVEFAGLSASPPNAPTADPSFPTLCAQLLASPNGSPAVVVSTTDEEMRQALTMEVQHWKDLARQQAAQLREVRETVTHLSASRPDAISSGLPVGSAPWTLKDLPSWAAENSERIVILPRALAAARKSDYEDPKLVLDSLELLAGAYRDMRLGLVERADFESALSGLHLTMRAAIDPARAGELGDEYFVSWGGRRRFLEWHIGRGTSRETRYTLRIYFFWDDDLQCVVVGSLPSHLDISIT